MKPEITNCVIQLRKKHQFTQEELASKLGVSRQTIISIEKGKYLPSIRLALQMAEVFNKPIEHIFTLQK
ncbi:MAG: helix-turn-helix transcriptional regulator [Candidatus Gracilibacteria bacterium]|nr:helix-turn-helix transcriptional regulator [Candidatus Gracilibacteria bacterium]